MACAAPESVRLARLCGVSSLHRKTNNVHYYCIFVFATGTDEMEHSKKFSFSLLRRREARHRAHCSVYVFFMTLITFCYFSSSIYFAFVKSHTATNRKDASWALPREKKLQKKTFSTNKFPSFFHLLAAIYYRAKEMGKGNNNKMCPRMKNFHLEYVCRNQRLWRRRRRQRQVHLSPERANFFTSTFDLGRCAAHLL